MAYILNSCFISFILNKKLNCKTPEWLNTLIISALKERSLLFKRYYRNHFEYNKETLLNQENVQKLSQRQKKYYIAKISSKLDCPNTASKIYWSKINSFLNKKKIPNQPPHLNDKLANGKLQWQMANSYRIFQKAKLFNQHFAEQCTLL